MFRDSESDKLVAIEKFLIENGKCITNKKLQKLLYFSQAWYVCLNNEIEEGTFENVLFPDKIYAWQHGPVVVTSYHRYKKFGFENITPDKPPSNIRLKNSEIKFLREILSVYDVYTADELENISHQHDPWKKVYSPGKNIEITLESMSIFYHNYG